MIQVLLADDHSLVRASLRAILDSEPDIEVCGEAADYDELVLKVSAATDVIVTDLSMPGAGIQQAMRDITEKFPEVPVVLISMCEERELRAATNGLGASGVLDKFKAGSELAGAIRTVVAGGTYPIAAESAGDSSRV